MSDLHQAIKKFTDNNRPPWKVIVWTYPKNGEMPNEYSAGYFFLMADSVDCSNEGVAVFMKGGGSEGQFVFITENIDIVEELEGGIRFPYPNFRVVLDDFEEYPLVSITVF